MKTLLIVDDEPDLCSLLKMCIEVQISDLRVETCYNGDDALEFFESSRPDVVVTDLKMPRKDGLTLTRTLADDDETRNIPIIWISGHPSSSFESQLQEFDNVKEVFQKPFDMSAFVDELKKYLCAA